VVGDAFHQAFLGDVPQRLDQSRGCGVLLATAADFTLATHSGCAECEMASQMMLSRSEAVPWGLTGTNTKSTLDTPRLQPVAACFGTLQIKSSLTTTDFSFGVARLAHGSRHRRVCVAASTPSVEREPPTRTAY
jgi:hypothetical protein